MRVAFFVTSDHIENLTGIMFGPFSKSCIRIVWGCAILNLLVEYAYDKFG